MSRSTSSGIPRPWASTARKFSARWVTARKRSTRTSASASIEAGGRRNVQMTQDLKLATDKMIARREGHVGWMVFNKPAKHNAVSFEMWQAAEAILDAFAKD